MLHAAACPAGSAAPGAAGGTAVGRVPAAEAMRLNAEGKQLYRQEQWAEARQKYAAALAADPEMLAAQLNLACSFSRQGRYAEAAQEAARLIRRAFVPWSREVDEAADLGILLDQAVHKTIEAAQAEAAKAWGEAVKGGVFFVGRIKPPVNVAGEGTLVLSLGQEAFAWIPRTGRYFQLTAEDGRVLAVAVSADRRHLAYLLAGRLVREPRQPALLRGMSLRVLEIPTMTLGPKVALPGDVKQVQLWYSATAEVKLTDAAGEVKGLKLADRQLVATSGSAPPARMRAVLLSGSGVAPGKERIDERGCVFSLAPGKGEDGIWRIRVRPARGKPFVLDTRYGGGLDGLPFPEAAATPATDVRKK